MTSNLSVRSLIVAAKDQVSCDLGDETAILSVKRGTYYGLNPVGARIWGLIQQPRSVGEVRESLAGEYDVEPERCERELLELLEQLLAAGLIEVSGG